MNAALASAQTVALLVRANGNAAQVPRAPGAPLLPPSAKWESWPKAARELTADTIPEEECGRRRLRR